MPCWLCIETNTKLMLLRWKKKIETKISSFFIVKAEKNKSLSSKHSFIEIKWQSDNCGIPNNYSHNNVLALFVSSEKESRYSEHIIIKLTAVFFPLLLLLLLSLLNVLSPIQHRLLIVSPFKFVDVNVLLSMAIYYLGYAERAFVVIVLFFPSIHSLHIYR